MQCSECSGLMSLRLDGLLDQEQLERVQTHVAECKECRETWEAMSLASTLLKAAPAVSPAPGFSARVAHRLEQREARRRRFFGALSLCAGSMGLWAFAGMAVVVLLAAVWRPVLSVLWLSVLLPLAGNLWSLLAVLGKASWAIVHALATRPTVLLFLGYAALALGSFCLWTRIVFKAGERRAG